MEKCLVDPKHTKYLGTPVLEGSLCVHFLHQFIFTDIQTPHLLSPTPDLSDPRQAWLFPFLVALDSA